MAKKVITPRNIAGPNTSQRTIDARRKQEEALKLRQAGATYRQIADALGYKEPSGAQKACQSAIDRIGLEPAAELVKLELQRLDQMQQISWRELLSGDTGQIGNLLRIMEMRARYVGLGRPDNLSVNQTNITMTGGGVQGAPTGMMVIHGSTESEYVKALASAVGMTEEEVAALKPGSEEDPMVIQGKVEPTEEEPKEEEDNG